MEFYDKLTGLYSGEGFLEKVEEKLQELCKSNSEETYLIIRFDIKNFKLVNAIHGMEAGDELLIEIADKLRNNALPGGIYSRLEGDKFAVFIAEQYGWRTIDILMRDTFHAGDDITHTIRINVGIYEITDKRLPVSIMCDKANMALATIKDNRMENVAVYDETLYEDILKEHELSAELPAAIKRNHLKMYLQPQVDGKGKVLGAEALIRWEHPKRGMLMPGDFLPYFENNYMIVEIDQYMWEQACALLKKWKEEGREDLYISVNISPRDFECVNVCEVLLEMVKKYDVNPENLKVEITESSVMKNPRRQLKLIGHLREAGFSVEMDDFGSGYSSLSMLKDIQIDAVKLDMRFLARSIHEGRGKEILQSIIQLIQKLDMTVIAEGVETKDSVEYLKSLGCDMFQGYYFAKPMKITSFEDSLLQKTGE
jgi:diguanylate cyclase (GGDEF)-like protein